MLKRALISGLFCSAPFLVQGCSDAAEPLPSNTGGTVTSTGGTSTSTGGTTASTGGTTNAAGGTTSSTGGTPSATGGAVATGGTSSTTTGGSTSAGGSSSTAGTTATGGSFSKGGSTSSTGGSTSTGGSSTGGTTAKGGSTSSGGSSSTGGSATTGGTTSTGGVSSTGGTASNTASTGPAETKPVGYGQNTTGGGSKTAVEAGSMSAVQSAIDGYSGSGGLVIKYTGKFNFASISDPCVQHTLPAQIVEIKQKNDITIIGADGSAANFGLHIASSSSNIIVRNMVFGLLPGGDASDAISIEGMSSGFPTNIWLDHNELFSSMVDCAGAGDTAFDGLIDLKKGADNVTVSYNYIHDHHKGTLNGYSDDDSAARHITFHHNVFEKVGSRTPLQRHGYSHMLNNLFTGITVSGINVRMDGYSLVEGNYFENSKNPVTSRDSSALGYWELKNNNVLTPADFTKFGITWSASSDTPTKDATDWVTTKAYPVALYTYTAQPAQCVKDGLKAVAGAGKALATLKCK
jgi:pectate lyase